MPVGDLGRLGLGETLFVFKIVGSVVKTHRLLPQPAVGPSLVTSIDAKLADQQCAGAESKSRAALGVTRFRPRPGMRSLELQLLSVRYDHHQRGYRRSVVVAVRGRR